MALNATDLGNALAPEIRANILANVPYANEDDDPEPPHDNSAIAKMATSLATAIATKVVEHITANAEVSTDVPALGLIAPSGGGPVTGQASGVGTVS